MSDAAPIDERHGASEDGNDPRPVTRAPMLRSLFVVLVGVIIGLCGVDLGVRWWDSDQGADGGNSSIVEHELLVWTGRPYFEKPEFQTVLDSFGNRNAEIPTDVPLDELRVAGFGASQVFGAGGAKQPDVWNHELERLLDGMLEHPVRVLNGGVNGYSVLQACRRAALLLDALEPDLVFVVISPSAQSLLDPSRARDVVRYGSEPNQIVPRDIADAWPDALLPIVAPLHDFFGAHSAIYRRHRSKFTGGGADRAADIQRWILSREPRTPAVEAMIDATLDEVEILAAACKTRGVELRMLVLPEAESDTEAGWREYLATDRHAGAPPAGTNRKEPTDFLDELLRERGAKTWNFYDEVDSMGPRRARFTMNDRRHWNREGHDVFAAGILERLRGERILSALVERRRADPRARPVGPNPFEGLER
jgi:hypothetical protein